MFKFVAALVAVADGAIVDRWSLDGHGNSRMLFSGSTEEWQVQLDAGGLDCSYPVWYTPFSSWQVAAGANIRDDGVVHVPLLCASEAYIWAVDADSGKQLAFKKIGAGNWDSYIRYMPDGSLVAGTNYRSVFVLDKDTLEVIVNSTALNVGSQGAQVLAITKTQPPQIIASGGGGDSWWGSVCDIVNGHELENCRSHSDTTVCMGADGVSMYNNQRFEAPEGTARYTMPLPSDPVTFSDGYISWPWWIRSDTAGNTYTYNEQQLQAFDKDVQPLWSMPVARAQRGLMLTDDENTVLLSNEEGLTAINAKNGFTLQKFNYTQLGATSCASVISPWSASFPVPLADGQVMLLCTTADSGSHIELANLETGSARAVLDLQVSPDQVLVDNLANVYVVGSDGALSMQRKAAIAPL